MKIKNICTLLSAGVIMAGFAAAPVCAEVVVLEKKVFEKTVDNFIVLYDSSSSMGQKYAETNLLEIQAEKMALTEANNTLPNLDWNAGLFVFTPGSAATKEGSFKTVLPVSPYNKENFGKAISSLSETPDGPTLLQSGLTEVDTIIGKLKGKTAVFIFTDGTYSEDKRYELKPLALAKTLVRKYDACIYVVSGATGVTERDLVKGMSQLNECSMVIPFEKLLGHPGYTTGALYKVVDTVVAITNKDGILFDFDKADLKEEYQAPLKAVAAVMEKDTNTRLVLAGYTDGKGSEGYNVELSKKRAESVRDFVMANGKIDKDRITLHWYGKADPTASNQTPEGRALNRRVVPVLFSK
jgi:OOP family OmpA-OmpF porin